MHRIPNKSEGQNLGTIRYPKENDYFQMATTYCWQSLSLPAAAVSCKFSRDIFGCLSHTSLISMRVTIGDHFSVSDYPGDDKYPSTNIQASQLSHQNYRDDRINCLRYTWSWSLYMSRTQSCMTSAIIMVGDNDQFDSKIRNYYTFYQDEIGILSLVNRWCR